MADKIKVLQFVGYANKGGVESVVFTYSKALKDYIEPTFVFFEGSTSIPEDFIEEIGGRYFVIPHIKHLKKFNEAFKTILTENQFDIIHSHVNTLSVFPLKVAKKCGYKIRIAHSHSQSNKHEFVRNLIKSFLKLFSKKYATTYLACGIAAGRYQYGNRAFNKGKVIVLHNAINTDKFVFNQEYRNELREDLGIGENDIFVGTIGRLCQQKNQAYILEMAKQLPNVKFVIVGSGPLEEDLAKTVRDNNLKNVLMYGSSNDPHKFYSALDCFVLPSLYEGVPVTGIEAQTNGVYTLFSDQVSSESKVSSFVKFLPIKDKDINLWVEELKTFHPHENHLQEVIDAGFSIEKSSKDLLAIYQQLLEK